MYRIITVCCYFGKLPEHFPEYLKSVSYNPTIDFLLVTDCEIKDPPPNVKVVNCEFSEMKIRLQKQVEVPIVLDRPYKLCDYKPIWGAAFHEYIYGYDFWGYCDMDLFFGDIRSFLPDNVLEKFDKIYKLGHLTYYRNTPENNMRYRLDGGVTYLDAFTTEEIVAFDEIAGMQNIFDKNKFPTYLSRDYADITYGKVQFTLSYFSLPKELIAENNYEKQLFYWDNGRVFRAYMKDGKIKRDEFNYIHFSRRKMKRNDIPDDCTAFFITNEGLFPKTGEITERDFAVYNPRNTIPEMKRFLECRRDSSIKWIKYYFSIIQRKLWKDR